MAEPDRIETLELARMRAEPDRYSFSWPSADERVRLEQSLARAGVLRPLWARPAGDGFVVLAGARRLAALREQGAAVAPVRVTDVGGPELWDRLLDDHADHRPWNPVEVGLYLVRRQADTGEALERLAGEVFPRLGLAPRVGAAAGPLWFAGLPPRHRDAAAEGRLPAVAARVLGDLPAGETLAILDWLGRWRLGGNRFAELARLALECAWRRGRDVGAWLRDEGLDRWDGDPQALRQELRRRRYPTLTEWEGRFARVTAELRTPEGVRVEAPQHFEGGRLRCVVTFGSLSELKGRLDRVRRAVEEGAWEPLAEFLG